MPVTLLSTAYHLVLQVLVSEKAQSEVALRLFVNTHCCSLLFMNFWRSFSILYISCLKLVTSHWPQLNNSAVRLTVEYYVLPCSYRCSYITMVRKNPTGALHMLPPPYSLSHCCMLQPSGGAGTACLCYVAVVPHSTLIFNLIFTSGHLFC